MGGAYNIYKGGEKCTQDFGQKKTDGKTSLQRLRHGWRII